MSKQTLLLDFDATMFEYTGWKGPDWMGEPLKGARHAALILERDYRLVCCTSRKETELVEAHLKRWGFPKMKVSNLKEPAHLLVDDRVIQFRGEWTDELIEQIKSFKPHWQKGEV